MKKKKLARKLFDVEFELKIFFFLLIVVFLRIEFSHLVIDLLVELRNALVGSPNIQLLRDWRAKLGIEYLKKMVKILTLMDVCDLKVALAS